jgi:hypothetical protein
MRRCCELSLLTLLQLSETRHNVSRNTETLKMIIVLSLLCRLVQHVNQARAALPRKAAAAATADSSSSDGSPGFSIIRSLQQQQPNAASSQDAAVAAASAAASAPSSSDSSSSSSSSVQGLVVQAPAELVSTLQSAADVAAVFADRVVSPQGEQLQQQQQQGR